MADIDKGLPNTRTKVDIPSEEEIAEEVTVQEPEEQKGPVEVIPEADGGAGVDCHTSVESWLQLWAYH